MRKKLFIFILALVMLVPSVAFADAIKCDERGNWKDFTIKLHDQSNSSYAKGERVYLDIGSLPVLDETRLTGFVLLKEVGDPSARAITAYLKDIFGPNSAGITYFIVPDEAKADTEYEIVRYALFHQTWDVIGTGASINGESFDVYKVICDYYALDDATKIADDDILMKGKPGITKIKVSSTQEIRQSKSRLNSISAEKNYGYIDGKLYFNLSLTAPSNNIVISLYNKDTRDKVEGRLEGYDSTATEISGSIDVPNYVATGKYELTSVRITDKDGLWIQYLPSISPVDFSDPKHGVLNDYISISIGDSISTIIGDGDFKIEEFNLDSNEGVIGQKVDVTSKFKWDLNQQVGKLNIRSALVSFYDEANNKMFSSYLKGDYDYFIIPTSAEEGTYKIKSINVELESYMGETKSIIISSAKHDAEYDSIFEQELVVKKEGNSDILYFNLANFDDESMFKIKDSKEDAIIMLDASRHTIVDAEFFDAIKESQRQLIIENGANQWVFNGTDVIDSKSIDVSMKFYELKDSNIDDKLSAKLGSNSIVIEFPDNGDLPGTALIRIKDEEVFQSLKNDRYYIYYLDEDNNKLNKVSMEVQKSSGGYIEFYINHNSKYVITDEEVKDTSVVGEDDALKYNIREGAASEDVKKDNSKMYLYIGLGVAILVIVFLLGTISGMSKKKNVSKKEKETETLPTDEKNE